MKKHNLIPILLGLFSIIIIVIFISLWIIAIVQYGGKPITEIPMWAWLFLK